MSSFDPNYWGEYETAKKHTIASLGESAAILETILRAVGGGVEFSEGRARGYTGKVTVDYPRSGICRVRTIDLAEGRWNPEWDIQEITTPKQREEYIELLLKKGVKAIDLDAVTKAEVKAAIRSVLDREIGEIVQAAIHRQETERYIREIAEEEANEQQRDTPPTTPRRPRGTRRA